MKKLPPENGRILYQTEIFPSRRTSTLRQPPGEFIEESARSTPVLCTCDVLVVGGGPAGTTAAIAAARMGARVTLVERYNHLGGLATGGLVIWIDRMTDWEGHAVIRGLAEELISRVPASEISGPSASEWGIQDPERAAFWQQRTAAFHGVVTHSPTLNPEWLKWISQQMLAEAGVNLLLHCTAVAPLMHDQTMTGVLFESKEGRFAIKAAVVIDATGDGDLFARAGAEFENDIAADDIHHCANTSWMFGGVDMNRWIDFRQHHAGEYSAFMQGGRDQCELFERPFVSWRNDIALFMGPRQSGLSGLDVEDQTFVEQRSRNLMIEHLNYYRNHAPGFSEAYLLQSAPQLGVRHTRRVVGLRPVLRQQWEGGQPFPDEIGVSPSLSPKFPNISVPYGSILPKHIDGLLTPGRHLACDPNSHSFMREIPQCWLTGHAAGVASAIAANEGITPRLVPAANLQKALLAQGAYLRTLPTAQPSSRKPAT